MPWRPSIRRAPKVPAYGPTTSAVGPPGTTCGRPRPWRRRPCSPSGSVRAATAEQHLQKRPPPPLHPRFQPGGAIAVAAGPGLFAVEVAAAFAAVGVLDADEVEVLLPVGTLLGERLPAEADFDPADRAVMEEAGLGHVAQILVAGDGAEAQGAALDGP